MSSGIPSNRECLQPMRPHPMSHILLLTVDFCWNNIVGMRSHIFPQYSQLWKRRCLLGACPIGAVLVALFCVGCSSPKKQSEYVVTSLTRFMHHHEGDSAVCGSQMDCDREEFRYTLIHKDIKFTVHCEGDNCGDLHVGEEYQCRIGSAFGDQWLDCGHTSMLEIDSAAK